MSVAKKSNAIYVAVSTLNGSPLPAEVSAAFNDTVVAAAQKIVDDSGKRVVLSVAVD